MDNFFSLLGQFCQIRVRFLRTFRMIIRRSIVFYLLHALLAQGGFAQFLIHAKNVRRARAVGRFFTRPFCRFRRTFPFFCFLSSFLVSLQALRIFFFAFRLAELLHDRLIQKRRAAWPALAEALRLRLRRRRQRHGEDFRAALQRAQRDGEAVVRLLPRGGHLQLVADAPLPCGAFAFSFSV